MPQPSPEDQSHVEEPKNLREAVELFCSLDNKTRESIVVAFERASPALSFDDLVASVSGSIAIAKPAIRGIAKGLASVIPDTVEDHDFRKDFIKFICDRVQFEHTMDRPSIASQLDRLFCCEQAIALTGKAQEVLWGHGKIYKASHAVTQIRPLFYSDLAKPVTTATIVHELRISYEENGLAGTFCMALDNKQLASLRAVLRRALLKEKGLRSTDKFNYLSEREAE